MKELAPNVFEPETREEFEIWAIKWPRGYVINRKSENDVTIHYAECGHFEGNVGKDLVTNRKVMSRNNRTLKAWWSEQGEKAPKSCRSCGAGA